MQATVKTITVENLTNFTILFNPFKKIIKNREFLRILKIRTIRTLDLCTKLLPTCYARTQGFAVRYALTDTSGKEAECSDEAFTAAKRLTDRQNILLISSSVYQRNSFLCSCIMFVIIVLY